MTMRTGYGGWTRAAGLLIAVATGVAACGDTADGNRDAAPDAAPELAAVTLAGDSVTLGGLQGQPVLLNVWATWCVPCRQEAPELQALHETHGDDGLRVVGVTVDNRGAGDAIRQFIDEMGMTYDIWWDPDGGVIDAFGAAGVPLTVLIDPDGRIAWRHLGAFHADDPALRKALSETL